VGTAPEWAEVPRPVAVDRLERLLAVQRRITAERLREAEGQVVEILCEGPSEDPARRFGRTSQNRVVHFEATEAAAPVGALLLARVTRAGAQALAGELVGPAPERA
jgi:tRNA-2-methylthio-N6-dimethylallyladenosine synthase